MWEVAVCSKNGDRTILGKVGEKVKGILEYTEHTHICSMCYSLCMLSSSAVVTDIWNNVHTTPKMEELDDYHFRWVKIQTWCEMCCFQFFVCSEHTFYSSIMSNSNHGKCMEAYCWNARKRKVDQYNIITWKVYRYTNMFFTL